MKSFVKTSVTSKKSKFYLNNGKKEKNLFFAFFLSRAAYVNAVTLGEMLQIWQHLCSKTNFYFWTESDIVLEQEKADNKDDDDEKELKLDWGSRV